MSLPFSFTDRENFTADEVQTVYDSMTKKLGSYDPVKMRKYDMDSKVQYPSTHPEYMPSLSEKALDDSTQVINQQYVSMVITLVATASLGMIVFMVSTTASSSN